MGSRHATLGDLEAYFDKRWRAAKDTPWGDVRGASIEREKAELLRRRVARSKRVLDLGCGGGDFLAMVAPDRGFERAIGVDVAAPAIERAKTTGVYHELHACALERAAEHVRERFDLVLFGEVLYYVPEPIDAVARAVDAFLEPHGAVAITLAVGRDYFTRRDVEALRPVLSARGMRATLDERIDYTFAGVARRRFGPLFPQTHKAVLFFER